MDNPNLNEEILAELRGIARTMKNAARQNLTGMIVTLVILLGFTGYTVLRLRSFKKHPAVAQADVTWESIRTNMEQGRFDEALSGAQVILKKAPNFYYPHVLLASIYIAENDLTQAEKEYEIAFKLWPDEKNEKDLKTIRKRIELEANKKK